MKSKTKYKPNRRAMKRLREALGWRLTDFADFLGISVQLLQQLDSGKINISPKMQSKILSTQFTVNPSIFFDKGETDNLEKEDAA